MAIKLITYDLNQKGQNYPALYEQIKSLGNCINPLDSVWLVNTSKTCLEVKTHLQKVMDKNDLIIVVPYGPERSATLRNTDDVSWVKKYL